MGGFDPPQGSAAGGGFQPGDTLCAADGTALAPGIAYDDEKTTGFYRAGSGEVVYVPDSGALVAAKLKDTVGVNAERWLVQRFLGFAVVRDHQFRWSSSTSGAGTGHDLALGREGTGVLKVLDAPAGNPGFVVQGTRIDERTVDATLAALDSAKTLTNRGAAGAVTLTAPASPSTGWTVRLVRVASQAFRFDPNTTGQIRYSGGLMAAGEYLELGSDGAKLEVVWDGTEFLATLEFGTLTEETP